MTKDTLICLLSMLLALTACGTGRRLPVSASTRDSTRVEIRWRTEYVRDTLTIRVPAQEKERSTADTTSHLETDFAESDASIDSAGLLHHTLRNKPQDYPVPVQTPVYRRDSIVFRDREVRVPEPYPVEVSVPRPLTSWQKTQMAGFWAFVALLALKYRRKILAVVRRFI